MLFEALMPTCSNKGNVRKACRNWTILQNIYLFNCLFVSLSLHTFQKNLACSLKFSSKKKERKKKKKTPKIGIIIRLSHILHEEYSYSGGIIVNTLSANPTIWSNTLKQFVGKLPTNCLSVFDHFVGLELNGLKITEFRFQGDTS